MTQAAMTHHGETLPRFIAGMAEVAPLYDGFIFDLWGVVHDGLAPYAGTAQVFAALKRENRKVWLLSNAPRRAHRVADMLARMGIAPDMYTGITTSGEAAWHALAHGLSRAWGRRCLHIGTLADKALYDGLDIAQAKGVEDADFIVCTSLNADMAAVCDYAPLLHAAAARPLPMICANPDRVVHVGEHLIVCPGALADAYEAMGGQVHYFGKPYKSVYDTCLAGMDVQKVLAVGDGMPTDIAGAQGAGLDCVLITGGIHRNEAPQGAPEENKMADFLRTWPCRPHYMLDQLRWS